MTGKFCVGIVLYNPSTSSVDRIINLLGTGITFVVYDNSDIANIELINLKESNLIYLHFGKNKGLSEGINQICSKAIYLNFEYLLFFDQDTIFTCETLSFIISYGKNIQFDDRVKGSIIAINFRDREVNRLNRIKLFSNNSDVVNYIINSGCLFSLKHYNKFKWFSDNFVDGIDYRFSFQSRKNNYTLLSVRSTPGLNHFEEQGDSTFIVFNRKIYYRKYPFERNKEFITSNIKLFFDEIHEGNLKAARFLLKSTTYYIITQILARILFFK